MIVYLNIELRTIQNSKKLIPSNKKPLQSKKTVGGVKTAVGIVSHPCNPLVFKNISLGRDKK
jgi:hypothetical protein